MDAYARKSNPQVLFAIAYAAVAVGIGCALAVPHRGSPPPVPWFLLAASGFYSAGMAVGATLLRPREQREFRRRHVALLGAHATLLAALPIHVFASADPWRDSGALVAVGYLSVLLGWIAAIPAYRGLSRGMVLLVVSIFGAAFIAGATWIELTQFE